MWDSLIQTLENESFTFLTKILPLEDVISSSIQNFWFDLPMWIAIFISTVIGAIVAIKIDRKFENKKRIDENKLLKESFSESRDAVLQLFFTILFYGIMGLFAIDIVKKIMSVSPTLAIMVPVSAYGLWKYNKNRGNKKLAARLQKRKK